MIVKDYDVITQIQAPQPIFLTEVTLFIFILKDKLTCCEGENIKKIGDIFLTRKMDIRSHSYKP